MIKLTDGRKYVKLAYKLNHY